MRKQEQEIINHYAENAFKEAAEYLVIARNNDGILDSKRLRTCSARVFDTKEYYFLKSYQTIVAFIKKDSGEIFDILRYNFGYTSTSSQHISKFIHDYTEYPWTNPRYTWREIK